MSHNNASDNNNDPKHKKQEDPFQKAEQDLLHHGDQAHLANVYKDLADLRKQDANNPAHLAQELRQMSADLHNKNVLPGVDIVQVGKHGEMTLLDTSNGNLAHLGAKEEVQLAKALETGQLNANAAEHLTAAQLDTYLKTGKLPDSTTSGSDTHSGGSTTQNNADTRTVNHGDGQTGPTADQYETYDSGSRSWLRSSSEGGPSQEVASNDKPLQAGSAHVTTVGTADGGQMMTDTLTGRTQYVDARGNLSSGDNKTLDRNEAA